MPEIIKCVESGENERLCTDKWKLFGSVSRLLERDRKWQKNTALLLQTTVHLEERSVYCVLVQGYKRDFKNQNIGNLQLSGFVIISEFSYRCEGDQQQEQIFRKSETRKLLLSFHRRPLTDFVLKSECSKFVTSSERKIRVIFLTVLSKETVTLKEIFRLAFAATERWKYRWSCPRQ